MSKQNKARELSACETMIMKLIWDADEDIAVQELIVKMMESYSKDYARTTMVTFLKKLADKGYVSTYRVGRASFAHAEKDEDLYKQMLMKEEMNFWFDGKLPAMVAAICNVHSISADEICDMRILLDKLEENPICPA
ncbi:MAG: BlaI/MecI/CopY family transcriptional regulator [Lachnospiraceae bacterium]|nr:BlaI/MecI/CopY family transcriptional regulator [Lachnospiraceae bacterium]